MTRDELKICSKAAFHTVLILVAAMAAAWHLTHSFVLCAVIVHPFGMPILCFVWIHHRDKHEDDLPPDVRQVSMSKRKGFIKKLLCWAGLHEWHTYRHVSGRKQKRCVRCDHRGHVEDLK